MTFSCYACEGDKGKEIFRRASLSPRQERLKNCDIGIYYRKKSLDLQEVTDILGLLVDRRYDGTTPIMEDEKHKLTVHFQSSDLFKENLRKSPGKELEIISLQRNILSQGRISFNVVFEIIGEANKYYFTLAVENRQESLGTGSMNLASLNSQATPISSSGPSEREKGKERETQETPSFSSPPPSPGKKRLGRSFSFNKLIEKFPFGKKDPASNLSEQKVTGDRSQATTSPSPVSPSSKNGSPDTLPTSPGVNRAHGIRRKKSGEREKLGERKELTKSKSLTDVRRTHESSSTVTGLPKGTVRQMIERINGNKG